MKKNFILRIFSLIAFTMTFISCQNFFKGTDLKEEINEKILLEKVGKLQVIETSPAMNAIANMATGSKIEIKFNKTLDEKDLNLDNSISISFENGLDIKDFFAYKYEQDSKTIFINIKDKNSFYENYKDTSNKILIKLDGSIKDTDGFILGEDFTLKFIMQLKNGDDITTPVFSKIRFASTEENAKNETNLFMNFADKTELKDHFKQTAENAELDSQTKKELLRNRIKDTKLWFNVSAEDDMSGLKSFKVKETFVESSNGSLVGLEYPVELKDISSGELCFEYDLKSYGDGIIEIQLYDLTDVTGNVSEEVKKFYVIKNASLSIEGWKIEQSYQSQTYKANEGTINFSNSKNDYIKGVKGEISVELFAGLSRKDISTQIDLTPALEYYKYRYVLPAGFNSVTDDIYLKVVLTDDLGNTNQFIAVRPRKPAYITSYYTYIKIDTYGGYKSYDGVYACINISEESVLTDGNYYTTTQNISSYEISPRNSSYVYSWSLPEPTVACMYESENAELYSSKLTISDIEPNEHNGSKKETPSVAYSTKTIEDGYLVTATITSDIDSDIKAVYIKYTTDRDRYAFFNSAEKGAVKEIFIPKEYGGTVNFKVYVVTAGLFEANRSTVTQSDPFDGFVEEDAGLPPAWQKKYENSQLVVKTIHDDNKKMPLDGVRIPSPSVAGNRSIKTVTVYWNKDENLYNLMKKFDTEDYFATTEKLLSGGFVSKDIVETQYDSRIFDMSKTENIDFILSELTEGKYIFLLKAEDTAGNEGWDGFRLVKDETTEQMNFSVSSSNWVQVYNTKCNNHLQGYDTTFKGTYQNYIYDYDNATWTLQRTLNISGAPNLSSQQYQFDNDFAKLNRIYILETDLGYEKGQYYFIRRTIKPVGIVECKVKNIVDSKKMFTIFCDKPTLVETFASRCNWGDDADSWRLHTEPENIMNPQTISQTQNYDVPFDKIKNDYYYCVIAHFADGTYEMSSVFQK